MLPGSSPGCTLGNPAGVIKPGGAVLMVLVGVVQAWGSGESHLLTSLKEQGIHSSCFYWGSPQLMASCRRAKNGGELRCACQRAYAPGSQ